ncbi:MAG: pyridoxal 5'-phosphate synthase glutaminase subunit PdxT [Halobacteriaceae archaeon]
MTLTAGVVAVQGDVSEHADAVRRAADARGEPVTVREVREAGVVPDCDALLLPGGESTTISRLLARQGIDDEIRDHVAAGKPVLATCAGLIVAAADAGDDRVETLDVIDATVRRNAFGRQRDSFEAPLDLGDDGEPFPAVFIRAPVVESVGPSVEVLGAWDGDPVAIRDGPVVGTAFHPELTPDTRVHDIALFQARPAEVSP